MKKKLSKENFKKIKLLVLDFDGVLTDNRVYVDENGKETVCCFRGDGLGLERLKKKKIKVMVLSKEKNKIVGARCRKLGIAYAQGVEHKVQEMRKRAKDFNVPLDSVSYLGNEINDSECIREAGVGCAVFDAHQEVRKIADYVTLTAGGKGAVREVCDLILKG